MPIYQLLDETIFPPVEEAEPDGLLAMGGDLSPERLLAAYAQGIFPWYSKGEPILWWSPNPRMLLFPHKFRLHKSLARSLKKKAYICCFDTNFKAVIEACAHTVRPGQQGTWLLPEMQAAYLRLHRLGYAHSVEVYDADELVGGLYGVSLGKIFFGESMFFKKNDASKAALYYLCTHLQQWGFYAIDAQQDTAHLSHMGGELVERQDFMSILQVAQKYPSCVGSWSK